MDGDKRPGKQMDDHIDTVEAKVTETSSFVDRILRRLTVLEDEIKAIRREYPPKERPKT